MIIVHGLLERRRDLSHALLVSCDSDSAAIVLGGIGECGRGEDANVGCGDPLQGFVAEIVLERGEEDARGETGFPVLRIGR